MAHLRPTLPGDVPGILALIGAVYAEYDCRLDAENEEPHLLQPGPHFREGGGEFWVVEDEGEIRATVAVGVRDEEAELKSLYVHPALRRQGWGRRLVEHALDHARRAGCSRLVLWSDTRFENAHRLYRALGFRECGLRELNDSNQSVELGFETDL